MSSLSVSIWRAMSTGNNYTLNIYKPTYEEEGRTLYVLHRLYSCEMMHEVNTKL